MRRIGIQSLMVTGGLFLLAVTAHAQTKFPQDPYPIAPQPTLIQETQPLLLRITNQDRIGAEIVVQTLTPGYMIRRYTVTRANGTSFTLQFAYQTIYLAAPPSVNPDFYPLGKRLLDHYRANPSSKQLELEFRNLYRYSNSATAYHMGGNSTVTLRVQDPGSNSITRDLGGNLREILLYGNCAGLVNGKSVFGTLVLKRSAAGDYRLGHMLRSNMVGTDNQTYVAMTPYLVGELIAKALTHTTFGVSFYNDMGTWFIHEQSRW